MRHRQGIHWTKRLTKPVKGWFPGHSPMQHGIDTERTSWHRYRTYVLCECGKTYSGYGDEGGFRSHLRHIARLKPVHDHAEGKPCNSGCMTQADFDAMHQESVS